MFRGSLSFASLVGVASQRPPSCPDCVFNLTALEEFSVDYNSVSFSPTLHDYPHGFDDWSGPITTGPVPDTIPQEHGTIALHARNLQLKLDSHATFPTPFVFGSLSLSGMTIHEELHINGASGQASFHLESPVVNVCFQLDNLPPVAQMMQPRIEQSLQQAEQIAPMAFQQMGRRSTLDGEDVVGLAMLDLGIAASAAPLGAVFFSLDSHPKFLSIIPPPSERQMYEQMDPALSDEQWKALGAKFHNYASSVGNQFTVRACEIQSQSATQTLLAASPEAQEFIVSRIRAHQTRLQALLEPTSLNTRFNFIPLEIADLMVPSTRHCAADEMAQIPHNKMSAVQVVAFSVCSFVVGISATFAVLRNRRVTTSDDYHQVVA